jgi:hypothetical protein
LGIGLLIINFPLAAQESVEKGRDSGIDLPPRVIQDSPVLQRWLKKIPNVLEDIRHDPSFRTRWQLGFSVFSSSDDVAGIKLGVEDIFLARTGFTISGDYQSSFNGDRTTIGTNLHYFLFPLGSYVNFAPLVGYRYLQSNDYFTDGINVGARLMLSLSRGGAADISLSQSFISPGGENEVGITNLSVGYALTSHVRLSTEFEQQNYREEKDNQVGINLEWIP